MMRHVLSLALSLILVAQAGAEVASTYDRLLTAARTASPPRIDGRLDDPAWKDAPVDDRFVQAYPREAQPPTERTETRVLYDDTAVYVAVHLADSQPDGIVARLTRRDREIESDWVAIGFDSKDDHRTGYVFQLNASGVQLDGMFVNDLEFTTEWDAVWDGAVTRDTKGWNAEFRIPLSTLRFSDAEKQEWGFQVVRYISRKKESIAWRFRPSNVQGEVSWFGRLNGLQGLRPRRTFELRPFWASRVRARTDSGGALLGLSPGADVDGQPDVGLDLKLGLTSSLTLDATINPDFGQVEADQVILNLSRFETFFPEKRPFFLEGADIYRTPLNLFYSRRVGRPAAGWGEGHGAFADGVPLTISEASPPLRIWGAGKLTGSIGRGMSLGLLGAVTGNEAVPATDAQGSHRTVELAPPRVYGVARGRLSLGGEAYVGVTATGVTRMGDRVARAEADHDAFAQAVDGFWQSTSGKHRVTAQFAASERVGGPGRRTPDDHACPNDDDQTCVPIARADGTPLEPGAVGFGSTANVQIRDGHLFLRGNALAMSPTFDINDAGFSQQYNQMSADLVAGYLETKPKGRFQSLALFGFGGAATSWDGTLRNAWLGADVEAELRSYFGFSPELILQIPGTWDLVETGDGGRLAKGWGLSGNFSIGTDSRKRVFLRGWVWGEKGLGGGAGNALGGMATLQIQASSRLGLTLEPDVGVSLGSLRLASCEDGAGAACTSETPGRSYLFAELDSAYVSLTARGTFTFSPRLSLQGYAQLFMARGEYSDYREIMTTGTRPFIDRDELRPSSFAGDFDGDGKKDDDFQQAALNLNLVLRWELLPGSTLFGVYTRAQDAAHDLSGKRPRLTPSGLGAGPTEDVFLIKLVYYLG